MRFFEEPLRLEECILYGAGHGDSNSLACYGEDLYRICSVTSGEGFVICRENKTKVSSGSVFVCFPYEKISVSGEFEYDAAFISVNIGKYSDSLDRIGTEFLMGDNRSFYNPNVSETLKNLSLELSSDAEFFSNELVSLLCSQLIVYVLRAFGARTDEKQIDEVNYRVCSRVMNYIDSKIYTMKNLREVATAMGYNYSYISTLFHKTTGMTLNGYFKNKRMNEAKKLLSDNKMSISEIARVMNYSSVYAFSKAFKEHFGASPGHYSGRFTK